MRLGLHTGLGGLLHSSGAPAPTFTSITPNTGPAAGGTAITNITGTGFVSGCTVTIGGASCTSVVFVNSTTLTAVSPAGTSGARNVVVTNPDTQTATGTGAFTYAAFSPADVGTLEVWFKGDAGLTKSGNNVTAWADQSGNANHGVQADSNRYPTSTATLNGLPIVSFSGATTGGGAGATNQCLDIASLAHSITGCTIVCVANWTDVNFRGLVEMVPNSGSGALAGLNLWGNGDFLQRASRPTAFTTHEATVTNVVGAAKVFSVTCDANNTKIWADQVAGTQNNTSATLATCTFVRIGALMTFLYAFKGDLAELCIYRGVLSDGDRTLVENALKAKWAV